MGQLASKFFLNSACGRGHPLGGVSPWISVLLTSRGNMTQRCAAALNCVLIIWGPDQLLDQGFLSCCGRVELFICFSCTALCLPSPCPGCGIEMLVFLGKNGVAAALWARLFPPGPLFPSKHLCNVWWYLWMQLPGKRGSQLLEGGCEKSHYFAGWDGCAVTE